MKLTELYIKNFKSAADVRLDLSKLTSFVGPNGAGKTTILEALDHFFDGSTPASDDFKNPNKAISISVTLDEIPRCPKSSQ